MKKNIAIVCLILCSALFLSACNSYPYIRFPRHHRNKELYAEEKLKLLVDALESDDKEGVRKLFSQKALGEAEDFEERLDELFEYLEGEIISYEVSSVGYQSYVSYGRTLELQLRYSYYIQTTEERYYLDIEDFYIEKVDPENQGFYILFLVKADDKDKLYDKDYEIMHRDGGRSEDGGIITEKIDHVGICVPFYGEEAPTSVTTDEPEY